ncbi:MAG: methylcobamide--CoM methyltransferase [Companilactobacillus sp.]|nr:methylcobamide--CoM methyltransferase [Companilactobacillus sp.]MCH4051314.1 methylcobamide--CoM methyltransferase [Companilactobacillus sp.]MCH4076450.1 methylcobamide--CoM methyltransferase [Companilactobacillus sp.]MCH4125025.1 methylcobamide--CoM methyltransferase [Companilactobacillus sp.]MCH4131566.1 methylcobamide--CoM methyltransferase [Companilactobacillus sp.]
MNFAHDLIAPLFEEINGTDTLGSIHVCRGNWTTKEDTLLSGSYDKLGKFFESINANMLTLEFSTPRAGDISALFENNDLKDKITLGLGVVNPRSEEVESVDTIVNSAEKALEYLPPERVWLNPDCGFATFSSRSLNSYDVIEKKMNAMSSAAEILRERHC